MNNTLTKTCLHCNEIKQVDEFRKNKHGHMNCCRSCLSKKSREYYEKRKTSNRSPQKLLLDIDKEHDNDMKLVNDVIKHDTLDDVIKIPVKRTQKVINDVNVIELHLSDILSIEPGLNELILKIKLNN